MVSFALFQRAIARLFQMTNARLFRSRHYLFGVPLQGLPVSMCEVSHIQTSAQVLSPESVEMCNCWCCEFVFFFLTILLNDCRNVKTLHLHAIFFVIHLVYIINLFIFAVEIVPS